MRALLALSLVLVSIALTACGGGDARLFADIAWRVRCGQTDETCNDVTVVPVDHEIEAFTGEDGVTVTCTVDGDAEEGRILNLQVSESSGSLAIRQARIQGECSLTGCPVDGATGCLVDIREAANSFSSECTPGDVSTTTEGARCRIVNVFFCVDDAGNPTVTGDLLCNEIRGTVNPVLRRDVTTTGDAIANRTTPVSFRIANCEGLSPAGLEGCFL